MDARRTSRCEHFPYLILGAGPAGVQLSYHLTQAGLRHAIVDRGKGPGTFFRRYPRHRTLLSINKIYTGTTDPELNLRWDWNSLLSDDGAPVFSTFSRHYFPDAADLVRYLTHYVEYHDINIQTEFDVTRIARHKNKRFVLKAADGRHLSCDRLILATGLSKAWVPDIPGLEHGENYADMSVDPMDYAGQRVLIVGKGNSAFETANHLVETAASIHLSSPHPLKMAWKTHFVGDLRAVNNNVLDTYQLKSQNVLLDADIKQIEMVDNTYQVTFSYAHAGGEEEVLEYDRVLVCTGFRFDDSAFTRSCRPALTACGRLPLQTSEFQSENVPGLFFAGTLMQMRDYKRYMSAFIHGFRYNVKALLHILLARYEGEAWPERETEYSAKGLCQALLDRANQASSLWQQPGFIADAVRLNPASHGATYFEDLPLDYAKEAMMCSGAWLTLTLEYGPTQPDPFCIDRVHRENTKRADESTFLHPIVRHYVAGKLVATHHVIEDLAAEWREREHVEPLTEFLNETLENSIQSSYTRELKGKKTASSCAQGL